jgi:hypothetical protein
MIAALPGDLVTHTSDSHLLPGNRSLGLVISQEDDKVVSGVFWFYPGHPLFWRSRTDELFVLNTTPSPLTVNKTD